MADENRSPRGDDAKAVNTSGVPVVRIAPEVPVIFADGVRSQSYVAGISKFYLFRTDNDPDVTTPPTQVIVGQVIMPAIGFANMVHFLEHRLKIMIKDGAISQETVNAINATEYSDPTVG